MPPLAQYTITVAQLVPQSSPLQRQAMPIIHEFGQTTPDNFAEVRSVPKAAFPKFDWSHVSLAVPTKDSETPITYRNELVRLARRFSGSNPDHQSVLATYFISLNGKINFGQRDESQSV